MVVWHSHLSEGERLDGWLALATGAARVVVGARSAVFAPVPDLRLVIVDEEHEPAYKQDETPRYHGRDVAVMRAKLTGAVCILGSATPSLESFANARAGKYGLLRLTQRVDDRKLPFVNVVDMRIEVARQRHASALSRPLAEAMQARFEKREQTMLFLNRRGYSRSLQCRQCGHTVECIHCSIALTYHRTDETLRCHLCGDQKPAPVRCPKCGAPEIRWQGLGTQRVDEAVRRVLPRARVERMDADTMAKKNRFRQVLSEFRAGNIDVLVGTQMIGKVAGSFPNVTLVGMVDADLSMHLPDFPRQRAHVPIARPSGGSLRARRSGGRGDCADLHPAGRGGAVFPSRRFRRLCRERTRGAAGLSLSALPASHPPSLPRAQSGQDQVLRGAVGAHGREGAGRPGGIARTGALADRKNQGPLSLAALVLSPTA